MRHSVWVLRGVLAAATTLALAGCYKGNFGNCAVSCASSSDCPGDLACSAQGLCSVGGASCEGMIPMPDADLSQPQPLTVTKTGIGAVASLPAGIDCGDTCMTTFPPLSSVTLTATPDTTSVFEGWTGDCASSPNADCALTMDGPKSAGAKFAAHGSVRWLKQISFTGQDYLDSKIDIDGNGNVVAAGQIDDNGTNAMYVVKYNKVDGQIMWEKRLASPEAPFSFQSPAMAVDSAGNVYMCARFQGFGSTTFNGMTVSADLYGNILAMRLAAADGTIEWLKQWGGDGQDVCDAAVVSGTDVFFTGSTSSSPSTFGSVVLTGAGVDSGFIVKVPTATGNPTAGQVLVGTFQIFTIAENSGQIAIGGGFRSNFTGIAGCNMNITGTGEDGFIMAFNNNLSCAFAKSYGSSTANLTTTTYGVAGVPGGGWIATGGFQGAVLFASSGSSIPNMGGTDAFIARYSGTGTHVYSFGYGTAGHEIGRRVEVLPTGEVVMAGEFGSQITFGSTTLTGTNDIFVTRLSSGNTPLHQWQVKLGGQATEFVNDMVVDPQGTVNILADWTGMTDVGGTPLTAQDYDAFVVSLVR